MTFKQLCEQLEQEIKDSYETGITVDDAEKLAGKFLTAQLAVSKELQKSDLDSRMRKSGLKAIQAAVYSQECTKSDKKPTEAAIQHAINMNEVVAGEQQRLDEAESTRDDLDRYYSIFLNAHIFYRGVAKGKFD